MVKGTLVDPCQLKEEVQMCVANGEVVRFQLAEVTIEVEGETYHLEAVVAKSLPADVLLGQDVNLG
jgi:predicted aspartyl protease